MTTAQSAAYINTQTLLIQIELESMKAANALRVLTGDRPVYNELAFDELLTKAENTCGYNACISEFRNAYDPS